MGLLKGKRSEMGGGAAACTTPGKLGVVVAPATLPVSSLKGLGLSLKATVGSVVVLGFSGALA